MSIDWVWLIGSDKVVQMLNMSPAIEDNINKPIDDLQPNTKDATNTSSTENTSNENEEDGKLVSLVSSSGASNTKSSLLEDDENNGNPPPIPHIIANIKPYSDLIIDITHEAYSELAAVVNNLPSSKDASRFYGNVFEEDLQRKKTLLETIVKIRNYFVKLYVLNKWARNSADFTKLIDVLNWLRTQRLFSDSLVENLRIIKRDMNVAKLPNHDLITSFIVLNNGYNSNNNTNKIQVEKNLTLLPTYNLIKPDKIPSVFTLRLLKHLRTLLHLFLTSLALKFSDLQNNKLVIRHSSIKDGKLYFIIPNEFEVVLTLINTDGEKCVSIFENTSIENYFFYALDFKFLFGLNDDRDFELNKISTLPSVNLRNMIEFVNGNILFQKDKTKNPLIELYEYLHSYCLNYKLYLIFNQLEKLISGASVTNKLMWGSSLDVKYLPKENTITIYYWKQKGYNKRTQYLQFYCSPDSNENKTLYSDQLRFKWVKDGNLLLEISFEDLMMGKNMPAFFNSFMARKSMDVFSIQEFLGCILKEHSRLLMEDIYNKFILVFNDSVELFRTKVNYNRLLEDELFSNDDAILEEDEEEDEEKEKNDNSECSSIAEILDDSYLSIKITDNKSILLSIDYLTGFFFFVNPSPSVNAICSKYRFKDFFVVNKKSKIISDTEREIKTAPVFRLENYNLNINEALSVLQNVFIIRLELLRHENLKILSVTGWNNSSLVIMNNNETFKLLRDVITPSDNVSLSSNEESLKNMIFTQIGNSWSLQYFQLKKWPRNWFLIVLLLSDNTKHVWISEIKATNNKWIIVQHEKLNLTSSLDYDSSIKLQNMATSKISLNIISKELHKKNIRLHMITNDKKWYITSKLSKLKFNHKVSNRNELNIEDSSLIILDNNSFLPSPFISNNLVLITKLHNGEIIMDIYGSLRFQINMIPYQFNEFDSTYVEIDDSKQLFHISTIAEVNDNKYLMNILQILKKISLITKLVKIFADNLQEIGINHLDSLKIGIDKIILESQSESKNKYVFNINHDDPNMPLNLDIFREYNDEIFKISLQNVVKEFTGQETTLNYESLISKILSTIRVSQPIIDSIEKFQIQTDNTYKNETKLNKLSDSSTVIVKFYWTNIDLVNFYITYDIIKKANKFIDGKKEVAISKNTLKFIMCLTLIFGKSSRIKMQLQPLKIENQLNGTEKHVSRKQMNQLLTGFKKSLSNTVAEISSNEIHFFGDSMDFNEIYMYEVLKVLQENIVSLFK